MKIILTEREAEILTRLIGDFLGLFEDPLETIGDGVFQIQRDEVVALYQKFSSSLLP